jgi:uncharacterized membrane protein
MATQSPGGRRSVDQAAVLVVAAGLALTVSLMVAGLAVWWATGEQGAAGNHDPLVALRGAFAGDAAGLLLLGILVLLTTPVVRIALLAVGFGRRREWLFVALAAAVLGELVLSAVFVAAR